MQTTPAIQIAYQLLRDTTTPRTRAELRTDAQDLARLLRASDVCASCWRLYGTGARGHTRHDPENCVLEEK